MIIGLAGKKGSGKSTISTGLMAELGKTTGLIKFAGPLYGLQDVIYNYLNLEQPKTKDRKLLQLLGTEWGRAISPNFWIDRYLDQIKLTKFTNIITDDVRFDNEAQLIRAMGGIVLLVVGPQRIQENLDDSHTSEAGVSMKYVDFIVDNSGTVQDTRNQLSDIVTLMKNNQPSAFNGVF